MEDNEPRQLPENVNEFIELLGQLAYPKARIELQKQALKLKEKEIDNAREYSIKSLELDHTNFDKERKHEIDLLRVRAIIGGISVLGFFALIVTLYLLDLKYLIPGILSHTVVALGSGLGAFHYGKSKGRKEKEAEIEETL